MAKAVFHKADPQYHFIAVVYCLPTGETTASKPNGGSG